jgi:hypothetical protein
VNSVPTPQLYNSPTPQPKKQCINPHKWTLRIRGFKSLWIVSVPQYYTTWEITLEITYTLQSRCPCFDFIPTVLNIPYYVIIWYDVSTQIKAPKPTYHYSTQTQGGLFVQGVFFLAIMTPYRDRVSCTPHSPIMIFVIPL